MAGTLAGKVALVTGAGKNIGRAIALTLARDGAKVVVNGRSDTEALEAVAAEIRAGGGEALVQRADVSEETAVAAMAAEVAARLGGVDILVCNAGLRRQTPFLEMSFAEWREILSVALDGAFLLARAFAPQMAARGGGAIVALSGISTHLGTPNRAHVSASKSGLEGLIRALAVELAPLGIRANCVAPGAVDTARGASAGAMPQSLGRDEGIPLRRKASVQEIADVVRLLAGPEGGYVTGQTIHVNGGAFLT
ncbi:SDR family oxidoreductase [Roseomonas alkaliterrae]|uniref:3-oxoacyl-[acyl-carrier protein] reductase n=1 Tax=Neoroseomonas alkaliterrae TaxID=1452450 RepID=A0A840XNH8_9PROT|nr:SDR family NAD(P)-dependent oxidoreductase [Neoroseomonas alkaliterrae]MBB5689466.1 3-oxoacyl-[acyl-carrier protein] reductase [Neoroseomonas alkaliterrae]MBR0675811.1 SDR family oxidoreductase [Neoroseomonas alkaliterrae]